MQSNVLIQHLNVFGVKNWREYNFSTFKNKKSRHAQGWFGRVGETQKNGCTLSGGYFAKKGFTPSTH
jgi:hypothetical protein